MTGPEIQYMQKEKLEIHPRNMRLVMDKHKLKELAQSIRECGIIQPLVGIPSPNGSGRIVVVVGNRRLSAALLLGDEAPLIPMIVRDDLDDRMQFEMMAVENIQRVDIDPISEALHYERLMDEFGTSKTQLARTMGTNTTHINGRLNLLKLQVPTQRLIAHGDLPIGACEHLLTIEDPKLQVNVAHRLAVLGTFSLKQIKEIIGEVQGRTGKDVPSPPVKKTEAKGLARIAEALRHAELRADISGDELLRLDDQVIPFSELNLALQATCAACYVAGMPIEIRWGDLLESAERTCADCGLDYLKDACDQCPLVELLSHLRSLVGAKEK